MGCEQVQLPGGETAIVCSRGRPAKRKQPKRCVRCREQFVAARAADTICRDCATDLGG